MGGPRLRRALRCAALTRPRARRDRIRCYHPLATTHALPAPPTRVPTGKPLREAQADMSDAVTMCDHLAALAEKQVRSGCPQVPQGTMEAP